MDGTGPCALEDPPTVVRLRAPGRPGIVQVVDVRNFGVRAGPWGAGAAELAVWLHDTMRRIVGALEAHGWGGLKTTVGSQSMYTWRRAYMTHAVTAHSDREVLAMERAAYAGGRCECFRLGRVAEPLVQVDVRSMYPHVCTVVHVPCVLHSRGEGSLHAVREGVGGPAACLAEVCVETTEPAYPSATPGGVIYPVGRVRTVLAGPELADAFAHDRVRHVGRWVRYRTEPALAAYALALHDARQEAERAGSGALSQWIKAMMVCLPGKLGQSDFEWAHAPDVMARGRWLQWWLGRPGQPLVKVRSLNGHVTEQRRGDWSYDAVPAAAAWVLSAARVRLLAAIRAVGWDRVMYCDTDSLIMPESAWDDLRATQSGPEDAMGQWRVVDRASCAVLNGVKDYTFGGRRVCAGLPRGAEVITSAPNHYQYRLTFGQALVAGHAPVAGHTVRRYQREAPYRLRQRGAGGETYPHEVMQW